MNYPLEVMNPLSHMSPSIRISPFSGATFEDVLNCSKESNIDDIPTMHPKFWLDHAVHLQLYRSGRSALKQELLTSGLTRDDSVMIITTTGDSYINISSCVMKAIEDVCLWVRELEKSTKSGQCF